MWTLLCALFLALTPALHCLDSNIIRSSKEIVDPPQTAPTSQKETVDVSSHNTMRQRLGRQGKVECSLEQVNECQRPRKRQRQAGKIKLSPDVSSSKVLEMGECLRSRDCEEGLCCAKYLTGRRCQRIPKEGEVCLLRGRSKKRRNLDRCDCEAKLQCRPQKQSVRGQGICHA